MGAEGGGEKGKKRKEGGKGGRVKLTGFFRAFRVPTWAMMILSV